MCVDRSAIEPLADKVDSWTTFEGQCMQRGFISFTTKVTYSLKVFNTCAENIKGVTLHVWRLVSSGNTNKVDFDFKTFPSKNDQQEV